MDGRRTDPKLKARACKMLRAGKTIADVSKETGVSRPTLYRWAREKSIDAVTRGRSRKFDREAICKMLETHTVEAVCEKFGCSVSYAYACRSGELEQ